MTTVRVRRVYDPPQPGDGRRLLVDRLWPRGVSKERAHLDAWVRDVAPSTALRKWFGHDPARWDEFAQRYRAELAANPDGVQELIDAAGTGPVTLVYAARDEQHNEARVLQQLLQERLAELGATLARKRKAIVAGKREREVGLVAGSDDDLGGDPPCWGQLFAEDALTSDAIGIDDALGVVDLTTLASTANAPGVAWSRQSDDLNVNLLVFGHDGGVEAHVNNEVDVLIVALSGEGILEVDGSFRPLRASQAVLIPKGSQRSIRAASDRFAYLTCHRRRAGLWPTPRAR